MPYVPRGGTGNGIINPVFTPVAYVDFVTGNDTTGVIGNSYKPFATLDNATCSAIADIIFQVASGTYGGGTRSSYQIIGEGYGLTTIVLTGLGGTIQDMRPPSFNLSILGGSSTSTRDCSGTNINLDGADGITGDPNGRGGGTILCHGNGLFSTISANGGNAFNDGILANGGNGGSITIKEGMVVTGVPSSTGGSAVNGGAAGTAGAISVFNATVGGVAYYINVYP